MTTKIEQLITPALSTLGYELWGLELHTQRERALLRVYIDFSPIFDNTAEDITSHTPQYIGLEDCTKASHEISAILDVENPITGSYVLEVSSPGEDRTIYKFVQYQRFLGQEIRVKLLAKDQHGKKKYSGCLQNVNEKTQTITITVDGNNIEIPFTNIEKTNLYQISESNEHEARKR